VKFPASLRYDVNMSNVKLRAEIKNAVDQIAPNRLESLANYVTFLTQPSLRDRLERADQAIATSEGRNWRKVRTDV
jgi:hypothetical protein